MIVGGKTLAKIPSRQWVHVEIEARLGNRAAPVFRLTMAAPGQPPQAFEELAISGSEFRELHWLGFSSTALADTAFYLDNLKIKPDRSCLYEADGFGSIQTLDDCLCTAVLRQKNPALQEAGRTCAGKAGVAAGRGLATGTFPSASFS